MVFEKWQNWHDKKKGFLGLWEEPLLPVFYYKIMGAPASCLFWGSYESFKYMFRFFFKFENKMMIDFNGAMLAECVSCLLWVPIDIIKERL